jgi:arylsulfatase A-like enzyme
LNDRLTDEAINWIESRRDKPFFVYIPHYAVHTPLQAKAEDIEANQKRLIPGYGQQNPTYCSMVESLDTCVGRLIAKLDEWKLAENTIVVFNSDNGGLVLRDITSNVPLRVGKGSAYEGGVRVPLIVRYPAQIKAAVNDTPVMSIDLLPTLVELATGKAPAVKTDGVSLAGILTKGDSLRPRDLHWHYPHYHPGGATPYSAIRSGDWRLVEWFEDNHVELYDLKNDIREKTDLAAKEPAKRDELRTKLHASRKAVGAQLPTKNPQADAARDSDPPAPKKNPAKKAAK